MTRFVVLSFVLTLSQWGYSQQSASTSTEAFDPMELIMEEPEKPATAAEMKPGLARIEALCLKSRQAFVKKYTAVTEDPKATCKCVTLALKAQKSMSLLDDSEVFYESGPQKTYAPSRNYLSSSQNYCRVDPKWKPADPEDPAAEAQPRDFEQKMREITEAMSYRVKPPAKSLKKPGS